VRAVDPAAAAVAADWVSARAAPLHVHVSEQPAENEQCAAFHGSSPTALLRDCGVFTARTTAVHATHVSPEDVATLGETAASVCLCPTTERDLSDGVAPTAELVAAGVELCVGSDSHAVIDPFEETRSLELHERLRTRRRGTHDAAALIAMATRGGHRSLGWDDVGTIAVGQRADLVTIRLDSVRTAGAGADEAPTAAVFAATASDVTHVVVDGTIVVEGGRHRTLDVPSELRAAIGSLAP
jgi:formiminoglutamate deiminase